MTLVSVLVRSLLFIHVSVILNTLGLIIDSRTDCNNVALQEGTNKVHLLGSYNNTQECINACINYNNTNSKCVSYTYFYQNTPNNYSSQCWIYINDRRLIGGDPNPCWLN